MDLGFIRGGGLSPANARPVSLPHVPVWPLLRATSAAAQAASPTAQAVAGLLRGQEGHADWVQELAEIFAPRSGGTIEAVRLGGSFNPLVASRLRGGKDDERGVYRGALADLQG
ncbi:hypothetical protein [Sphingobium cloacae]|uniref:Uncharacterized protein n=1 Tax=Sphingobium cloacae TaxID=120107 RepID=A0A1E1F3S7_9SPHN|nr:hypothetical protein [Sphingobium cloacae]BAV65122.1 hypothetical protein SCLO_1020820 [Sphingobium cloacae]